MLRKVLVGEVSDVILLEGLLMQVLRSHSVMCTHAALSKVSTTSQLRMTKSVKVMSTKSESKKQGKT